MGLDIYLRLRAAHAGRAERLCARRHVHLSQRPLVVVGYHLAGEPGAPVALRYGSRPDDSHTLVVPEPRDRTLRFARLARFAADLARYLDRFSRRAPAPSGSPGPAGAGPLCVDAPQLLCPNAATAQWLTDALGRQLRYLRPDGPHPVDPSLPTAGAHLTFFAEQRVLPGSCLVLTATELLTTHWCTGQLPVEDQHLGAVLAWVDPPPGTTGPEAALVAEQQPPAGPLSDPAWDRERLQPLIGEYARAGEAGPAVEAELAQECADVLEQAWQDTWRARDLVAALPEAAHVPQRWDQDRRAWTRHLDRVVAGTANFRIRQDQLRSFRFLHELERRTVALARQMALDDPVRLAAQVAAGDALAGEVVERDCAHRIASASGRRRLVRPLLRLRPVVPFHRPAGTELWWTENTRVRVEIRGVDDGGLVELMVVAGANRSVEEAERTLPAPGARMAFVDSDEDRFPDVLPERLPWTHEPAGEEEP
jgi:hypothetical protein